MPKSRDVVDQAKSADFLLASGVKAFRALYPGAQFKLFEIGHCQFLIVVADTYFASTDEFKKFSDAVPITLNISVSDVEPNDASELDVSKYLAISHDVSLSHTAPTLLNTLRLRHSELSIIKIDDASGTSAPAIILPESQRDANLTGLTDDIAQMPYLSGEVSIQFQENAEILEQPSDDVFSIASLSVRTPEIQSLKHVRDDDEKWYWAFENAANGELRPSDFNFVQADHPRSVILPMAEQHNLPDLRNYFLLYDRVLLEVPLLEHYEKISYGLADNDFAEAAARGKLQLLVTQPEERLPFGLLREVEEANPNAIIGRRASAAYAMSHFANRFERFERRPAETRELIAFAGEKISEAFEVERDAMERIISSPVSDYYTALERLRHNDLKAISIHGADDAFAFAKQVYGGQELPDLRLEFSFANNMTTIGGVFDAEVALGKQTSPLAFPADLCSTLYSLFGEGFAAHLQNAESATPTIDPQAIHPEGPLFEFSQTRPLSEMLDLIGKADTPIASSLLSDLARLEGDARTDRIKAINDVVDAYGGSPTNNVIGEGMPNRFAKWMVGAFGAFIPPIAAILTASQLADEAVGFASDLRAMKELDDDVPKIRSQVELLSKTRKIARLTEKS